MTKMKEFKFIVASATERIEANFNSIRRADSGFE